MNKEKLDKIANILLLLVPVAMGISIFGFAASERDPFLLVLIVIISYRYIPIGLVLGLILKALSSSKK